jgi:hypothetical protein
MGCTGIRGSIIRGPSPHSDDCDDLEPMPHRAGRTHPGQLTDNSRHCDSGLWDRTRSLMTKMLLGGSGLWRALYYGGGLGGRTGNGADTTARRETGADQRDKIPHLAKVRVAGSNPVFRSKKTPDQGQDGNKPLADACSASTLATQTQGRIPWGILKQREYVRHFYERLASRTRGGSRCVEEVRKYDIGGGYEEAAFVSFLDRCIAE